MKSNYASLVSLAEEVERQEEVKQDYLAPSGSIRMENDERFIIDGVGEYDINNHAHGQLSNKLEIPKRYYDKMGDVEGLRSLNVNAWLRKEPEKKRLVRTLDGRARAFLSDRYRPMDNFPILSGAILPVLTDYGKEHPLEVKTHSLSETNLYLQVTFPAVQAEIVKGDIVQCGLTIKNSEVGAGALDILLTIWRCWCNNGAIAESVFRKHHIGSRIEASDDYSMYADDTIQADLESYKLRMRDVVKHTLDGAAFMAYVERLQKAAGQEISKVTETVQNVTKHFNLSESDSDSIITNMINEGNSSRYGLFNGITQLAHNIESPDRQFEIERIGSSIITLTDKEWSVLAA